MSGLSDLPTPPAGFVCPRAPRCTWVLQPVRLPPETPDREALRYWLRIASEVAEHLGQCAKFWHVTETGAARSAEFDRMMMFGPGNVPETYRSPLTASGSFDRAAIERLMNDIWRDASLRVPDTPAELAPSLGRREAGDARDTLPRRRNPAIGCRQVEGTWIHGRPHDCPRFARGR